MVDESFMKKVDEGNMRLVSRGVGLKVDGELLCLLL